MIAFSHTSCCGWFLFSYSCLDAGGSFLITAGLPSALFLFLLETKKTPPKWFLQNELNYQGTAH